MNSIHPPIALLFPLLLSPPCSGPLSQERGCSPPPCEWERASALLSELSPACSISPEQQRSWHSQRRHKWYNLCLVNQLSLSVSLTHKHTYFLSLLSKRPTGSPSALQLINSRQIVLLTWQMLHLHLKNTFGQAVYLEGRDQNITALKCLII